MHLTNSEHIRTPSVDIVIPALNEEATIAATIEGLADQVPGARFIIADNGSTDATRERTLRVVRARGLDFVLLSVPTRGKGNAIREAFRIADADVVIMVDGDDTYPAECVHALIGPVVAGYADMVVGDRLSSGAYGNQNSRRFHEAGNQLVLSTINRLYRGSLRDILSGYRAFSKRFVRTYPVMVSGFELETDLSIHALDKRLRVVEVPIDYRERPPGSESKLNTFRDGARVVLTLFNLFRRFRPLAFFVTVSVILAVLALAAGGLPIADWIQSRYVAHVPLAILASALVLASLIFFAVALVLDALADRARRDYELRILEFEDRPKHEHGERHG